MILPAPCPLRSLWVSSPQCGTLTREWAWELGKKKKGHAARGGPDRKELIGKTTCTCAARYTMYLTVVVR